MSVSLPRLPAWARTGLGRFARNGRGATAVEFALVALPFVFLIFSILEIALIFLVNVTLENAVSTAAREIRTGQQQETGISGQTNVNAFRQSLCNNMSWLSSQCLASLSSSGNQNGLVVDIRAPSSFASTTEPSPVVNGQLNQYSDGNNCFYSGSAGSIVVVRAFYPWMMFTPFLYNAFYHLSNGAIVLQAAEVFQNEPYGGSTNPDSATAC